MASLLPDKQTLRLLATLVEGLVCVVILLTGGPFLLQFVLSDDKPTYLSDPAPFIIAQVETFKARSCNVLLRLFLFLVPYTLFFFLISLPMWHLLHNLIPRLLEVETIRIIWAPFQLILDLLTQRLSLKAENFRLKEALDLSQKIAELRFKRNVADTAQITKLTTRRADRRHETHIPRIFKWNLTPELIAAGERVWTWGDGSDQLPSVQASNGTNVIESYALSPEDPQDHGCPICLADFAYNDNVEVLPCSHVFHESCLKPWLQKNFSCARCQRKLVWVMALKPDGVNANGRK